MLNIFKSKKSPQLDDATILKVNRQCYDELGEDYTDGPDDLEAIVRTGVWKKFINNLPAKHVLNVGCGTGDASVLLDKDGFEVTSIDLAPSMVKITSKKLPHTKTLEMSATEIDKLPYKYDGIIAIHLIQSLNKKLLQEFLQKASNLLSEEGKLLLVFTNHCYVESGYQPEGTKDGLYTVWFKWNLEDIVPFLNKAHLKPIELQLQKSHSAACGVADPFAIICRKN